MNLPKLSLSRRETLAGLAATTALPLLSTPAICAPSTDAQANALLATVASNLLRLYPTTATGLGVDTAAMASLRSRLPDRSAAGQRRVAQVIQADFARVEALDTSKLSFTTRTSVEVVKYAFKNKLEGLAFPYGDAPVAGDAWRNTPYVVIQNVGAYIDTPQLLDTDHPIENHADAEAYLARLSQFPAQLDGELERIKSARAMGLVPPSFLIDKAIEQLNISLKSTRQGGTLVESLGRRTREKKIPGDWEARARRRR